MHALPSSLAIDIVEALPVVVVVLDDDGTIDYINPFLERLSGRRLEDVRGQSWFSSFPPERDRARIAALFRESAGGKAVRGNVNPIVTTAGEERDIEWHARSFLTEGDGRAVVAVGIDVTEALAARTALQRSESHLRESQRIARVGSWELDLTSRTLVWTDEVFAIFEIDPQRFGASYDAFLALVHPDDRAAVDRAFTASVRDRTSYEIVHRLRMPDGRIKFVREAGRSEYDGDRPVRSMGTVQDITTQIEQDHRFERILDGLTSFIGVFDRDGTLQLINDAPLRLGDLRREDVIGRKVWETPWWSADPAVVAELQEMVRRAAAGETVRKDLVARAGPATTLDVDVTFSPLRSASDTIVGILASGVDVSARVAAERRLAAQLREKEVLLRELHHRVKNNLQMVTSLLYLQQQRFSSRPDVCDVLEEAAGRVRALALVHEHLYRQNETQDTVDLFDYAHQLVVGLQAVAQPAVAIVVDGEHLQIPLDDAIPLGLILNELVSNAIKHAFRGGPGRIVVSLQSDSDHVVVEVKDDGLGLALDDPAALRDGSLGLRLVDRLVEQIGAALHITTGTGTTFSLRLPRR